MLFSFLVVAAVLSGSGGNQGSLPSSQASEFHAVTKRSVLFPGQQFATGGWGRGIDAADLDGDGLLDLVTSLWEENEVSVLIGKPGNAFRDPVRYPSGEAPYNVAVGDLDGDGKADVVGVNNGYEGFTDGNLTVHLNNGDGTLLPAVGYAVGENPTEVLIEDVNGDGIADLISADSNSSSITVLAGVGDGTFQPGVGYLAGQTPRALVSGRLNEDPFVDLVVLSWGTASLDFLIAGPGGSFTNAGKLLVGWNSDDVELVDVDLDGIEDLLTLGGASKLSVFLGLGGMSFAAAQEYDAGFGPSNMVVADLDRDGLPDVATTSSIDGYVCVLYGLGGGAFGPEQFHQIGDRPDGLVAGYLDQDGWLDLAIANRSADATVLRGSPRGMISVEALGVGNLPSDAEIADVNGDEQADLLAVADDSEVQVWLATASGGWVALAPFSVGSSTTDLACVDLDGDPALDLVVANFDDGSNGPGDVRFFHGLGDGTFSAGAILVGGIGQRSVEVLDLTGDGLLDISLLTQFAGLLTYVNDGVGGYALSSTTSVGGQSMQHAVGDLNGDAIPDVAVVRTSLHDIQILLGLGSGSYVPGSAIPLGTWAYDVELGDLNGDGILDVAAGTGFEKGVFIGLGLGNGQFSSAASPLLANNNNGRYLVLEDFDVDGALDVAVSVDNDDPGSGNGSVNVFYGRGDGTFLSYRAFAGGSVPSQLASGDVTGDGLPELALVNMHESWSSGSVFVYRNLLKPGY